MEQLLVRQLSSLQQSDFQLLLRANSKKISVFQKEFAQYLAMHNIKAKIVEQEDNFLPVDKIQILSETRYSNNSTTSEVIYTGVFSTTILQYTLSHCKQKCFQKNEVPPNMMLKLKIEPIIRFQYRLDANKAKKAKVAKKGKNQEDEKVADAATQRKSTRSNRHMSCSRKNQEDHSSNSYHGRKCYCCSHRSEEESEQELPSNVFNRSPKKFIPNNKENSVNQQADFQTITKKTTPQALTHPLSKRGNSSQSDRNKNSPNLYFRKHLITLTNKKGNEESNRNTKISTNNDNPPQREGIQCSKSSNWIKTKRNQQVVSNKKSEEDEDRPTQLKQLNKFGSKLQRKDDKVFQRAFKQRLQNCDLSEEESKERDIEKLQKGNQTAKNSFINAKIEIDQRYSEMSADHKLQALEKGISIVRPGLEKKMMHNRNESSESWLRGKKEIVPISKIIRTNEPKPKNNDAPIVIKSKERGNLSLNRLTEKQNPFIDKSTFKNDENFKVTPNRIKKIPLTQKMQMIKHVQEKTKNSNQQELEPKGNVQQSPERKKIQPQYRQRVQRQSSNKQIVRPESKSKFQRQLSNNMKKGEEQVGNQRQFSLNARRGETKILKSQKPTISNFSNKVPSVSQREGAEIDNKRSVIPKKQLKQVPTMPEATFSTKQNEDCKFVLGHEDDNFSVTQQKINRNQDIEMIKPQELEQLLFNDAASQPKIQNDLASTIKEIKYEDEFIEKSLSSQQVPNLEPLMKSSGIHTSRTIPYRTDLPQETQQITDSVERENEEGPDERQYFDRLFDQNLQNQNGEKLKNEQVNPLLEETQQKKFFSNCNSESIIGSKLQIPLNNKSNGNSVALIPPSETVISHPFQHEDYNEEYPSQYSSTKQINVKQDSFGTSNNRISIDCPEPEHSERSKLNAKPVNSKNYLSENSRSCLSENRLSESNIEQFQRQLFDVPKSQAKETNKEEPRLNKMIGKDFLRLETIDEVNESIYRHNERKEFEEKLNSVSVSSSISNSKLKENVSNISQKMSSDCQIPVLVNERSNNLLTSKQKFVDPVNEGYEVALNQDRLGNESKIRDPQMNSVAMQKPLSQSPSEEQDIHKEETQKEEEQEKEKEEEESIRLQKDQNKAQRKIEQVTFESNQIQSKEQSLDPKVDKIDREDKINQASQNNQSASVPSFINNQEQKQKLIEKISIVQDERGQFHEAQRQKESKNDEIKQTVQIKQINNKSQHDIDYLKQKDSNQLPLSSQVHELLDEKLDTLLQTNKEKQCILQESQKSKEEQQNSKFEHHQQIEIPHSQSQYEQQTSILHRITQQAKENKRQQTPIMNQSQKDLEQVPLLNQIMIKQSKDLHQEIIKQSKAIDESSSKTKFQDVDIESEKEVNSIKQSNQEFRNVNNSKKQEKEEKINLCIEENVQDSQDEVAHEEKFSFSKMRTEKEQLLEKNDDNQQQNELNSQIKLMTPKKIEQLESIVKQKTFSEAHSHHQASNNVKSSIKETQEELSCINIANLQSQQQQSLKQDFPIKNLDTKDQESNIKLQSLNNKSITGKEVKAKDAAQITELKCTTQALQRMNHNVESQYHQQGCDKSKQVQQQKEIQERNEEIKLEKLQQNNNFRQEDSTMIFQKQRSERKQESCQQLEKQNPLIPKIEKSLEEVKDKKQIEQKTSMVAVNQSSIEVQTDYILPNEEENENLIEQYYNSVKSHSDHLAKKKCQINLCGPQIINSFQDFSRDNSRQSNLKQLRNSKESYLMEVIDKREDISKRKDLCSQQSSVLSNQKQMSAEQDENITSQRDKIIQNRASKQSKELKNESNEEPKVILIEEPNIYDFKLKFRDEQRKTEQSHPMIISKLVYKDLPIVQYRERINCSEDEANRRLEMISNCKYLISRYLPDFLKCLANDEKTEICLFINNQWILFKDSKAISLQHLLLSNLQEQSIYKCLEMMTGMPMRILKDKEQEPNKKRLIKSVKSLLEKRDEQRDFQTVIYGLNKMNHEVVSLEKVRYFLDHSKIPKSILQCKKHSTKNGGITCNFQGEIVSEFIQVFLLKYPRYLTLTVNNTAMNTYEIELTRVIFYVAGTYKFILYEETATNEYKLIKQSFLWLKHKNQQQFTKYLLILEPISQKEGQHIVTMRLATNIDIEDGNHTNRVVKYQNGGKTKGYQGGYQNQKNLYLPVMKEILKQ